MTPRSHALVPLFSVALLMTGCASTAVIRQATVGETVRDEVQPIERAYRSPAGGLVLCTRAALAGSREVRLCTLFISDRQLELPAQPYGYRGRLIELPRSVIGHGWPDEAAVRRAQLTPIRVRVAALGLAIEGEAEALRNRLEPAAGTTETIYNVRGYGTGDRWEVVYVRGACHYAFTVQSATVHPYCGKLLLLPWGVLIDGVCCIGTLYGGGVPPGPDFWDNAFASQPR